MAAIDPQANPSTTVVSTQFDGPPTLSEALPEPSANHETAQGTAEATSDAAGALAESSTTPVDLGAGIEGEARIWEARYAMLNFLGGILMRILLTLGWFVFAYYAWVRHPDYDLNVLTWIAGALVVLAWLLLLGRMAQAYYGRYYELTSRRLFVSSGLLQRRRDMMELLRVKDVFTRQNLLERWLSLGTVVIVSSDRELPMFNMVGVRDPKTVMDLIWHHARAERDHRSVKVDKV